MTKLTNAVNQFEVAETNVINKKKTQQKCVIDFSFQRITSKWKKMRSLTSTKWKKKA